MKPQKNWSGRADLTPLLTHSFPRSEITEVYRVFGERLDGVLKVGIRPLIG
jgi:alcohol dehydrogenase